MSSNSSLLLFDLYQEFLWLEYDMTTTHPATHQKNFQIQSDFKNLCHISLY